MIATSRRIGNRWTIVDPASEATFAPRTEGEAFGSFLASGAYVALVDDTALTVFVRADLA